MIYGFVQTLDAMFFVQSRKKTKRLGVECQKEEDKYEFRNTNRKHLYGTE